MQCNYGAKHLRCYSHDLGDSLQKEHDEHEALRAAVGLVYDDPSLVSEQEGSSLAVRATRIVDWAHEIARLALGFGAHHSFVIARSHYENIDLAAMSQGYAPRYTDTQLDKIEKGGGLSYMTFSESDRG
jgi:hypothetical protein